jgi:hypothetical protein
MKVKERREDEMLNGCSMFGRQRKAGSERVEIIDGHNELMMDRYI